MGKLYLYRMLAKNPKTGKDLRIISLDTSVWRDQKTIVWLDEVPSPADWSKWDIGVTTTAGATALEAKGIKPDIVLCLGPHDESKAWLSTPAREAARLVVVPKALVDSIGMEAMLELRMNNLLCLDEMASLYPFVGVAWDGTVEDAKALVALALHFGRSFPVAPGPRSALATKRGLKLLPAVEEPKRLWLVTQYYRPDKSRRRKEIDACLEKNLACPLIDRVVLLNESAIAPKHPKIEERVIGKRLTYADVIRWIHDEAPADVIVVFANSDIFLDTGSWRSLWSTDLDTQAKFLALLRWDVEDIDTLTTATLFGPRADSQDTWVVSAAAVKAVTWDWPALNFPFGQGGCDNAITVEMFRKRFLIANPALTLKTYHYHASGIRNYDPRNIVDKPAYLYIQPTGLHDMRPVMDIKLAAKETMVMTRKPFARPVRGPLSAAQARTFCTMVGRVTDGKVALDESENIWSPPPVSLYRMEEVFQTREGLVYTYDSILVGNTKASGTAWADSQLSSMAASLPVQDAMVAPLSDAIAKDPARFVLEYMAKVFLLRDEFESETGEFWCPKNKECIEAIKMFQWPQKEVPVLSRDENLQTWCTAAAVWPYQDTDLICQEEVGALRRSIANWAPAVTEKQLVIIVDGWITDAVADNLESKLDELGISVRVVWPTTSLDTCLRYMRGAWGVLMASKTFAPWSWVLPKGAFVWEIQSEMEPSANLLHLAAAAELHHRLVIVPKGVPNDAERQRQMLKIFNDMKGQLGVTPKQLIMPAPQLGFYGHAGDSFREMARMWAERGYVELVEQPTDHVWLGAVGDVLLYDRPTLQWLADAKWRKALFGNPAPPPNGISWSFWPRRPQLVEAAASVPAKSFEARDKTLVFYGRSENAVQKERRCGPDWASACDEFDHRVSSVDKYTYTQAEYLQRLGSAKYGLCLAGYGYKCHREIECMAMGTVPVVAPEVDMTGYADPPQEGLHYFRVVSPEDAASVKAVTAERWTVMSAACRDWWRRNASVDGLWELTKRLTA